MFVTTVILALATSFSEESAAYRTCIPKMQFMYNEKLCYCDAKGRWSEENCINGSRRRPCLPGHVIRQGCNQCTCDSKGEFICTNVFCIDHVSSARRQLTAIGSWCIPLKYYTVNCTNCLCPASGQTSEALCTVDTACLVNNTQSQSRHHMTASETTCMPNVMYIFPCLQCLCSEDGKFLLEKCFEVCQPLTQVKVNQECKPGSFYRYRCNVCQCSNKRIRDDKLCTNASCDVNSENNYLVSLRNIRKKCTPYTFTRPICLFCDCTSNGTINEDSCIVTNCSTNLELRSANFTGKCDANEVVPVCVECFCLQNGSTNGQYCSRGCNYQSKFKLLERILGENIKTQNLIQKSDLKVMSLKNSCKPNSIYLYEGKYCICGSTASSFKLCKLLNDTKPIRTGNQIHYDVDMPCKPQTFVDFDCNTCYCSKKGKIDPKWCTYDDCNAKRSVQESHKRPNQFSLASISEVCTPGSISKDKCNFCICPESGLSKEKACTKNYCTDIDMSRSNVKFTCEPLAYYEVDCNVCYCPSDGLKNVAKCTKNLCEKKFLRSDACLPGQLFSEMCNVCLCPPNGNREDKVCTNHTCHTIDTLTNFEMSDNLLDLEDRGGSDTKRSLDLCFPGEQFTIGCKNCVCPDMGLKMYAECDASQCNEHDEIVPGTDLQNVELPTEEPHTRVRRDVTEPCLKYNVTEHEKQCTPGTMYIMRCQLCICPYMGHIIYFCRPLNKDFYCEQPFPYVQYEPMGRRERAHELTQVTEISNNSDLIKAASTHNHTKYACEKKGQIMDKCFVCECNENNFLIEEHCFRRQDEYCANSKPTFLEDGKVILD